MSITISFTGDTPNAIRDEALQFFNAQTAERATPQPEDPTPRKVDQTASEKDLLIEQAKGLGIKVDKRWSVKKLQSAIDEATDKLAEGTGDSDPFDGETQEPEDPFSLDEPEDEPEPATKEDVRAALVGYQTAVKEKLLADGTDKAAAAKKAMNTARELLKKAGGTDNLGGLDESKYDKVVKAAEQAKGKL